MHAFAKLCKLPVAPRKVRLVVDLIRGVQLTRACALLANTSERVAPSILTLLKSAESNWRALYPSAEDRSEHLYVLSAAVDGGKSLRRVFPAAKGRANHILKRSSHVTITVGLQQK